MKPITLGQTGPAVEDVQQRLARLGYALDAGEVAGTQFGPSTLAAVRAFRSQQGLPALDEIDEAAWLELVDATYQLGDRTLYLRLPYFHGADVSNLQMTLNVLGFSCGEVDGLYGPHTEAAVREFQTNMGILADGIAFQDTYDAIERLHHVWRGKTAHPEFSVPHMGFARAVDVLEEHRILIGATDPIARSVASRAWNVACATTCDAQVELVDLTDPVQAAKIADCDLLLLVATAPLQAEDKLPAGTVNLVVEEVEALAQRLAPVVAGEDSGAKRVRVELAQLNRYDGTVTNRVVQTAAITLLDAACAALA